MLPGFRFLFAATFLTLSILVFGLGAAALLRAAHEQFATNPSWHAAPDATFVQQAEPAKPLLAMLRVATPAPEQKAPDDTRGADVPAIAAPAEQSATVQPPAEPAKIAALMPEPQTLPAAATSDMPAPQSPAPTSPAAAELSEVQATGALQPAATPAAGDDAQAATMDPPAAPEPGSPPASQAAPTAAGIDTTASSAAASPVAETATMKTAALEGQAAAVEAKPSANMAIPKPDPRQVRKQLQARRAAHRRRMAARAARLARLAAEQLRQQQLADPFGLRFAQPAAATQPMPPAQPTTIAQSAATALPHSH